MTMRVVAGRSSRRPSRPALRKCWPHRLSCSANLFKGSSSSRKVDTMSTNLKQPVTRIPWVPSPHCSTGPRNLLIEEPLDADAWLRTIESKFSLLLLPCSEANKARYAAQQLRGSSHLWWNNYHGMLPVDYVVTWEEFRNAFRSPHIPEGLMERKLN